MKEISFKLISNGIEIINEKTSYYEKDNTINFCVKGDIYKFDKKNFILRKKDKEKELVINIKTGDLDKVKGLETFLLEI